MKLVTYKPRQQLPTGRHCRATVPSTWLKSPAAPCPTICAPSWKWARMASASPGVATKKAAKESGVALGDVKLMAPVTNPNKVIAIVLNYPDHIR